MAIERDITERIEAALPGAEVTLTDLTGGKDHWQARIVAPAFEGQSRLARQRAIFAALGELMHGPIHALTMETLTPAEAAEQD